MYTSPHEPGESAALQPSDHLRLLIDLLEPVGPTLARRWIAALHQVPKDDREAVVTAVEAQILREYPPDQDGTKPTND